MVISVMLARQITLPPYSAQRNSLASILLQPLELSCLSFCKSLPLFSIACSLFSQNTRGAGVSLHSRPSDFPTFRPADATLSALCFHDNTNPFFRKSFIFTSMQIARGCGVLPSYGQAFGCRTLFGFDPLSP